MEAKKQKLENLIKKQDAQIKKQDAQIKLMRKLSTCSGFYKHYFELLKSSQTKEQAFDKVNSLFFQLFNINRYSDYSEFSKNLKTQ